MLPDMASAIARLEQTANRLAELVQWQELAEDETRPGIPPAFRINYHFGEDARDLYGLFLQLDQSIRFLLNRSDLPWLPEELGQWLQQMADLEDRVRRLRITERFKNS